MTHYDKNSNFLYITSNLVKERSKKKTIKSMAHELGMSCSFFNRLSRYHSGYEINDPFLISIERIYRYLKYMDMNKSSITEQLLSVLDVNKNHKELARITGFSYSFIGKLRRGESVDKISLFRAEHLFKTIIGRPIKETDVM